MILFSSTTALIVHIGFAQRGTSGSIPEKKDFILSKSEFHLGDKVGSDYIATNIKSN